MNQEQKECLHCHAPFLMYRTGKGFHTGMVEGTTLEQHVDGRYFAVAVAEDSEGWGSERTVTRVKFCPWCGRKLTKKIGGSEMKYYETEEPFYSLIVANNAREALNLYREMYGNNDDPEKFNELSRQEALHRITSAKTEYGDNLTYEEVKEDLDAKAPTMLLVDRDIL